MNRLVRENLDTLRALLFGMQQVPTVDDVDVVRALDALARLEDAIKKSEPETPRNSRMK